MRTPPRDDIAQFVLEKISKHPEDVVSLVSSTFGISRPRAYEHVMRQVKLGKVIKTGRTSATKYFLANADKLELHFQLDKSLKEDEVWAKYLKPKISAYSENVYRICNYGFTEILNNAIDHSEGSKVLCTFSIRDGTLRMTVLDNGVGIFYKIQHALNLPSAREAVLHLSKGKLTTDPTRHSGQGIFFTSRVMDNFGILSDGMQYRFYNGDWLLSKERALPDSGTYVFMEIRLDSTRTIREVFDQYSDIETGFHKTVVAVELSDDPNDPHVSRSQAKRLLAGCERFKHILLDFKNVPAVGQAFVDEIFRVFQNEHPDIKITYVNANSDVDFMIKRGLATT
jgi:anti-sigma regulatory factor (Ser/Thr protein kinase)